MIFPGKHISQEKALLTVGAELLKNLDRPKTVSAIWEDIRQPTSGTHGAITNLSYDWFILALDLLFIFDAIEIHDGLLKRRTS